MGFSLLELLIVIAIIMVLMSFASLSYHRVQARSKEVILKQDLYMMRQAIEMYVLDRSERPNSLEDLVSEGYLGEVPVDPITHGKDWQTETLGSPSDRLKEQRGIVDVHSSSMEISSDGTPYRAW